MNSAEIVCERVSLGYETGTVAEGLDFTVHCGDYLCILGENGSGKSTLVKALLGLHPAQSGRITRNVTGIGYLPQQTVVQKDFPASVREIFRSGCLGKCGFRPFYTKAERDRAEQNMERLGITALARRCYRELSGGQQQRVLLARALCSAVISVLCAAVGIMLSILFSTPFGSTIVTADIAVFLIFCGISAVMGRVR